MVSEEWLIKVSKNILPLVEDIIKNLNGGHLKVIKNSPEDLILAIPIKTDLTKIILPEKVKRITNDDCSVYEVWEERR